jgi:hypothetical protein
MRFGWRPVWASPAAVPTGTIGRMAPSAAVQTLKIQASPKFAELAADIAPARLARGQSNRN